MKKLIGIFSAVVLISCLLSSCASHERCPAYGKIEKQPTEQKAERV